MNIDILLVVIVSIDYVMLATVVVDDYLFCIIIITIIIPEKIWNGVHLEDEEREVPEIHGCPRTGMREMGINNLEWVDREGWRRKKN